REFLPKILPGMLGVFLAALLASVMSSCDSFMIASSALFTQNVYKPLLVGRSDRHYMRVGRVTSLVVVAAGVGFAFWLPDVVTGLEIFWKIAPMMGIAFWLGLFWRRTTIAGAWAATLAALGVWLLTTVTAVTWTVGQIPAARSVRLVRLRHGKASPLLKETHLRDAAGLARRLRDGKDPVSAHIKELLRPSTTALLAGHDDAAEASEELRAVLVNDLNLLLEGKLRKAEAEQRPSVLRRILSAFLTGEQAEQEDFYEQARFANVVLSSKTRHLIAKNPEDKLRVRLNRRLLEEAYPGGVWPYWAFHGDDIKKPVALARRVHQGIDPVAAYVREHLPAEAKAALAEPTKLDAGKLRAILAAALNQIAGGRNIYDRRRFAEIAVSPKAVRDAESAAGGEDLARANTRLLTEVFVWEIASTFVWWGKSRCTAELYLPWQMILYLAAGTAAGIAVSLLTKPVNKGKLDRFYALSRTPVKPGEQRLTPCTLPQDAVVPPRRNLLPSKSLEIPVPTWTSVVGFLAGWAAVGAIICGFMLLLR
ncbi:MAG: hypothetical protein ISS78_04070, partial [Phycisphaerae bacterium]|nr:hypothetical protein [Phycisphaerae bacterium]